MEAYFSSSYVEARSRFLESARSANAELFAYDIDHESIPDLTIDVAIVGKAHSHTIVISSAVHGVEGFFGSAVQLALLEQLNQSGNKPAIRYVFIHAVNPYGFSQVRRVNEDNIDLNRNFLIDADEYKGAPEGYAELDSFVNPKSPPSRFEPFKLRSLWIIFRKGLQALLQTVATGQFEYPEGLFFGGRSPSISMQIIEQNCDTWLSGSEQITHIDLHTGLGKSGDYKLLLIEAADSENYPWYIKAFGEANVEAQTKANAETERTAYTVRGSFGEWMQHRYGVEKYRFMAAEFGTHHVTRVLAALRADNRAHFYSPNGEPASWVKDELLECLCPKDVMWRRSVITSALDIIEKAQTHEYSIQIPEESRILATHLEALIEKQKLIPGFSLQQAFYKDPDIYRHDMERIFYSDWIYACHTSQIAKPGDCETFDIDTESVIVARDQQMNIQAFANVCRHRGSRICPTGSSKNKRLSCPYHAWTYGLDGNLLVARLMPDDFDKSEYGLKKIATEVFCGMVFVNLSDSPESFDEVKEKLQGALAAFELENTHLAHYESHPIDANWKLTYENFFECYHCGPAHKEYAASHSLTLDANRREGFHQELVERAEKAGISTERVEVSDSHQPESPQYYHHRQALYKGFQTGSEDGNPVAPLLGSIKAYDGGASDIMIGALTYLVVYADHAVLYRFSPRSVDQTDAELFWFVRADAAETDVDMERLKWLWHITTIADKKIIEDNQQGVNSRFYEPGPYSPMEAPTKEFTEWYLARIS